MPGGEGHGQDLTDWACLVVSCQQPPFLAQWPTKPAANQTFPRHLTAGVLLLCPISNTDR